MKDSREYSKQVQKLYRSLKRKYPKPDKVVYDEPVDAIVYSLVSEKMDASAAEAAMKRFSEYFVNWNDLRVSRQEEIIEILREDNEITRALASALCTVLRGVFEKYNFVSLAALKKMSKRPAKQFLGKMNGMTHFAVNYCMLTALHGHAIPLTQSMVEYLQSEKLVHPEANQNEIESFLARQIPARSGYEFYELLRRESESAGKAGEKKTERKTELKKTIKSVKKTETTEIRKKKK